MTRAQRIRSYLGYMAIAVVLAAITSLLARTLIGGREGTIVGWVAFVTLWMLGREYLIRYRLPARARDRLECLVDPSAGPPAGATPVEVPPVGRAIADAVNARDSRRFAAALDPKFRYVNEDAKRSVGRRKYVHFDRTWRRLFPTMRLTIDAAATEDPSSEVVWVRLNRAATPLRGQSFEITWWERWTLDPAHGRVLESRPTSYVRLI